MPIVSRLRQREGCAERARDAQFDDAKLCRPGERFAATNTIRAGESFCTGRELAALVFPELHSSDADSRVSSEMKSGARWPFA